MLAVLLAMSSIRWMDAAMLALSWMLFLTLILCLHYASVPGIVVSFLAMAVLFAAFWREWGRAPTEERLPASA
jgi:predicted membrane metal-binding protein